MNIDDIKKGLECCVGGEVGEGCRKCPYLFNHNGCNDALCKDTLDFITLQEKKVEQLTEERNRYAETLAQYQMASDKEIRAQIKQAKIEVLNKLRERVETAIDTYFNLDGGGYYLAEGAMNDIDELLKEYENDT